MSSCLRLQVGEDMEDLDLGMDKKKKVVHCSLIPTRNRTLNPTPWPGQEEEGRALFRNYPRFLCITKP